MKFQVIWTPRAEGQLADLWLKSARQTEFTAAVATIDSQLRDDPLAAGESRYEDFRIVFEGPLAIRCEVRLPDLMVIVFDVVELGNS